MSNVYFHLGDHLHQRLDQKSSSHFFVRLWRVFEQRGVQVDYAKHRLVRDNPAPQDGNLHIVQNGLIRGRGVLNAAETGVSGFWQLDPNGVLADSSLVNMPYLPQEVPGGQAQSFFQKLRRDWADRGRARYDQPVAPPNVPKGAIVFFHQGESFLTRRVTSLQLDQMLRALVAGSRGRPVVVKPHPVARRDGLDRTLAQLREEGIDIPLVDGNIHQVLKRAAVTASINSGASVEGFLHRRQAITFGQSDFHHFAHRVTDLDQVPDVIDAALQKRNGYARFMWWYLAHHSLGPTSGAWFFQKVMTRVEASGLCAADLGIDLSRPPEGSLAV